jgi:hypothetical protein
LWPEVFVGSFCETFSVQPLKKSADGFYFSKIRIVMESFANDNYARIVQMNLVRLFDGPVDALAEKLPARESGDAFIFNAFGSTCILSAEGIMLDEKPQGGPLGILISLYALYANREPCRLEPFKAFKEFADSMPYVGAFSTHAEKILVPHVKRIQETKEQISQALGGMAAPDPRLGDFSLTVYPLPKVALCYIFYHADEEFPAAVTCLFSNNALSFLPIDALADVGEYTSRKILAILNPAGA